MPDEGQQGRLNAEQQERYRSLSDEELQQVHQTLSEVVQAINRNDYMNVMNRIGAEYLLTDTFRIKSDVTDVYYILSKYHKNIIDSLDMTTDHRLDNLSRMRFDVALFEGFDSTIGYKRVTLRLYVGPPEIIPLDKLSGFEADIEVDAEYRGKLREAGKLLDIEEIVEGLGKKENR